MVFALTLARHGETEHNKNRIIQGQTDVPLSDTGLHQADDLASLLQNETYTHIFSSDLQRAKKTAEIILKKNKSTCGTIVQDARLRERKFGILEGKNIKFLEDAARTANAPIKTFTPSGAETIEQVHQRAIGFFRDLCQQIASYESQGWGGKVSSSENGAIPSNNMTTGEANIALLDGKPNGGLVTKQFSANVLVVSHGGFIREMIRHFADDLGCPIPGGKKEAARISPNAAISKFLVSVDANKCAYPQEVVCLEVHNDQHVQMSSFSSKKSECPVNEITGL